MKYYQVYISAENKKQAEIILNSLLKKKLVAGGLLTKAPAKFWWKDKIEEMNFIMLAAFSIEKYKEAIIADVKMTSVEEVPMIQFIEFEGNREMLWWIDDSLKENV
jgi:uncharacterized protein involved in tolerance to divalent cations